MTKSGGIAIMLRSQLKRKFNNNKSEENSKKYKQQRNYCVKLLRKTKVEYFQNMNVNKVNDNKMFWKTMKPRFSNKCKTASKHNYFDRKGYDYDEIKAYSRYFQ